MKNKAARLKRRKIWRRTASEGEPRELKCPE
jgi:hypothetical protein